MDSSNGVRDAHGEDEIPPMPTPTTATSLTTSTSPTLRDADKDDAQTQVITSLRAQITDLITQVSQLNGKLVGSYDRVSDLEDALHVASSSARAASLKIAGLEIERSQHLSALDTGLYVEKAHVTAELTRLMERATAEAAARGQAESARHNIEHELDDLSASLFGQANTMVAEARLARAMSERKVIDAEMALHSAEEAVGMMQQQMQALRDEKDRAVDEVSRARARMEKGKFLEQGRGLGQGPMLSVKLRLLSAHAPYQEYMQFIVHLRSIRHSTPNPPHISTLLPLPFLARIQTEDSDPTVRLDFAPSLNWLSRRSVLSAIHGGQLTIEPVSLSTLLSSSSAFSSGLQSMIAGSGSISCALCGAHIFPPKSNDANGNGTQQSTNPLTAFALARGASPTTWSTSLFKSAAPSPPPTPPPHHTSNQASPTHANEIIYVFRVAPAPGQPPQQTHQHTPSQTQNQNQTQRPTSYPLCNNGWCLARLRATCSLWAFVRAGVVDRVWEEYQPNSHLPTSNSVQAASISSASAYSLISSDSVSNVSTPQNEKDGAGTGAGAPPPPLPPRRRSKMSTSVGALWGMASGALRGSGTTSSQPASPVRNEDKEKEGMPPKLESGTARKTAPEPLSVVTVPPPPPPVPRRSLSRRVTESGEGAVATGEEERHVPPLPGSESNNDRTDVGTGSGSPTEVATPATSTSEKTPIARSGAASPALPPTSPTSHPSAADTSSMRFDLEKIAASNSQGSSSSMVGEEFTTPVEEIGSLALPLAFSAPGESNGVEIPISPRPTTPHSPPRSPRSPARASFSPPRSPPPGTGTRSPKRMSSPPPPRSPRATPLPDSRPGTPGTPHRTARARPFSGSVGVAPLNLNMNVNRDAELGSRPPSRAASPAPGGFPPPVPRRAAARRAVPPPPPGVSAGGAPPASVGSGIREEKEPSPTEKPAQQESVGAAAHQPAPPALPPPALPPRRPEHAVQESISDGGDGGGGDVRLEEVQMRLRAGEGNAENEKKGGEAAGEDVDGDTKNYVGDATWEERTWKEIVRLREDMFWARVGGLRG